MNNNEMDSTQMDDIPAVGNGQTEAELLDAVMRQSPIMDELAEPLPDEEIPEVDPVESDEDPSESEEIVSEEEEEVEESEEEAEGEDAADAATQDTDVFTADDLDLEAKVSVKIDGEEMNVSFGDLIKGYQTDAHLSKKGRELGEAQKAMESERDQQLKEVLSMAEASSQILMGAEQRFANEYRELDAQIEKARADGDTYELSELKDKREISQKNYWGARQRREGMQAEVAKAAEAKENAEWQQRLDYFSQEIPNHIPDFDEKVATGIRDFAVSEGLSEEILAEITDPVAIRMINDYRLLKQGVSKGAAKRKAVPAKKAVPTKKSAAPQKKAADKEKMIKARAFKEDATADDQMDFLRQYASKSLNL